VDVVIDTTLVIIEVIIDGKGSLHGTVIVELSLDGCDGCRVDDGASLALVLSPGLSGYRAGISASSSFTTFTRGVGPAVLSNGTSLSEIIPNPSKITTIAAVVTRIAGDGVLRSKIHVLTSNTESIRESIDSTESPA
jgi:hypothetical protein